MNSEDEPLVGINPVVLAQPSRQNISRPPGERIQVLTESDGTILLTFSASRAGMLSRILPALLPLLMAAFFVWSAEQSHQKFLAGVPESSRAFFSSSPRPLYFFSPFLVITGGFFLISAGAALRQSRLRIGSENVTLAWALPGLEFGRRSTVNTAIQGVSLTRTGQGVVSYKSGDTPYDGRIRWRTDATLVWDPGKRGLARDLTPQEGQWLREALPVLGIPVLPIPDLDLPERSDEAVPEPGISTGTTSQIRQPMLGDLTAEHGKITGFDLTKPEPDILVIQPNKSRSREQATGLIVMTVFLCVWVALPLFFWLNQVGILHSPVDPKNPGPQDLVGRIIFTTMLSVFALAPVVIILLSLYVLIHDEVLHRLTPIILDRQNDRLRYGKKVICPLSSIQAVILRRIEPARPKEGKDALSDNGVAIRLKDGRSLPRRLLPTQHLRYGIGTQKEDVVRVVRDIATFIGTDFELRCEKQEVAPRAGMGGGF